MPLVRTENKLKEVFMNEEEKLVLFKEEFIKDYVDRHLDALLDLRNAVQKAENFEEVHVLMAKEGESIRIEFGLEKPRSVDTTKIEELNT